MQRIFLTFLFGSIALLSFSQKRSLTSFLADSSMRHASVSICIKNTANGETIIACNSERSLMPASVMKLVTSAVALELLGPQYTFITKTGYTGSLNSSTGLLTGNIIIKGGGDPALGSEYFTDHYGDFLTGWVEEIHRAGIRKIEGKIIADDSYYDFLPVPAKWLWEDLGNYYGAGVYGLSAFDNIAEIHLNTSDSLNMTITGRSPAEYGYYFENRLKAAGRIDRGFVFAAPYSSKGWMAGTIPAGEDDFVLNASVSDPPMLLATILSEKLKASGITIKEGASTARLEPENTTKNFITLSETVSPPLAEIIEVLNHESVNLFAEHLLKELGKTVKNDGSTAAGAEVEKKFLSDAGIKSDGLYIEDGSGLSPLDALDSEELVDLLVYMKNQGKYFNFYLKSLPDAGKEGTLRNCFRDPVFDSRLNAKSGSMTRVRNYAGYFTTISGKSMAFSILVNNFSGPSVIIISHIEDIIKEIILSE